TAIVQLDTRRDQVTFDHGSVADFDQFIRERIAGQLAVDHDILRMDIGVDLPFATDGQVVTFHDDGTFDGAFNVQVFGADQLTAEFDVFTDYRAIFRQA